MAKGKTIYALYSCTECKFPSKVTRHGKKPLKEMSRYCRRCRKHTPHKSKDLKKPVKK